MNPRGWNGNDELFDPAEHDADGLKDILCCNRTTNNSIEWWKPCNKMKTKCYVNANAPKLGCQKATIYFVIIIHAVAMSSFSPSSVLK